MRSCSRKTADAFDGKIAIGIVVTVVVMLLLLVLLRVNWRVLLLELMVDTRRRRCSKHVMMMRSIMADFFVASKVLWWGRSNISESLHMRQSIRSTIIIFFLVKVVRVLLGTGSGTVLYAFDVVAVSVMHGLDIGIARGMRKRDILIPMVIELLTVAWGLHILLRGGDAATSSAC